MTTHAELARLYIATIHNCTVAEAAKRLTAGELADMYEREARAWGRLWPEEAERCQARADEQALIAVGEDMETGIANKIAAWLDEDAPRPHYGRYA